MKTVKFTTRKDARNFVKAEKEANREAKLVDNGNQFKGEDRWHVACENVETSTTLKAPVKPSGKDKRVFVEIPRKNLSGNATSSVKAVKVHFKRSLVQLCKAA